MNLAIWALGLFWLVGFVHPHALRDINNGNGISTPNISIVGGTPAAFGEFPHLAHLVLNGLVCGGTLIGPYHILTAAHCLERFNSSDIPKFEVYLNTLLYFGGEEESIYRGVSDYVIHEGFNKTTWHNDIALLVLNEAVKTIAPVTLPKDGAAVEALAEIPAEELPTEPTTEPTTTTKPTTTKRPSTKKPTTKKTTTKKPTTTKPKTTKKPTVRTTPKSKITRRPASVRAFSDYVNKPAVVAGWGRTSEYGGHSYILLKADVTIQHNYICELDRDFDSAIMLCAAGRGTDTCGGDSGGPIYVDGVQVGITSYGYGCPHRILPGFYARVSNYLDWIATTQAKYPGKESLY